MARIDDMASCSPLGSCKVVHFLRHAEAESNAAAHRFPPGSAEYNDAYASECFFDSVLSDKGVAQCRKVRQQFWGATAQLHCDAVICSPLRRTLQTAQLVFGAFGQADGIGRGSSIPWVALEEARENSNGYNRPCDCRRTREQQLEDFPHVDFSAVPDGEDTFSSSPESTEELDARCAAFLECLRQRPEHVLAVVSHSAFLERLFARHLAWPREAAKFANCELRSVVLRFPSGGDDMAVEHGGSGDDTDGLGRGPNAALGGGQESPGKREQEQGSVQQ